MEFAPGKCKKKRRKNLHIIHDSFSESSFSSNSEKCFSSFKCLAKKKKKGKNHSRHDYLTKLFERKKLKEKSLSKKMKTPFDRKINRSCWPIELKKVSRIKKKPCEKRKEKPTQRSLSRKKFTNPTLVPFISQDEKSFIHSSRVTDNPLKFLEDDSFKNVCHSVGKKHYLYEQITPQMLMAVLQDREYSQSGVTIDMIILRLRTLNTELNPSLEQLREEILHKLHCAIKLGLVIELNGYYRLVYNNKISKKKTKQKAKQKAKQKHCCYHTHSDKSIRT